MKLIAFDLDGTLLVKNSSFAFCHYLFKKKEITFFGFCTCIVCYLLHKYGGRSLLWLHTTLFRRLFLGKKLSELEQFIENFLDENLEKLKNQRVIEELMQGLKTCRVCILSNSPDILVKKIAKRLGCHEYFSTRYSVDDRGRLCDIALLVDGEAKAEYLKKSPDSPQDAYSDSILDLPFLETATTKIAVNPDRKLAKIASARGWRVL